MKLLLLTLCVGLISSLPSKLIRGESYGANPDELGDYYEGDIMLAPGQSINDLKNGLVNERYRWPSNEVPYVFEDGFTEDELASIRKGFTEYKYMTCVSFVERTDQNDYIRITNHNTGCHSYIGRIGGGQQLNYQSGGCITRFGTVLHELYHALGFYHEQSRWDRDDYVTIIWDNIDPNYDHNFYYYSQSHADAFGQPYDYGSMMHYSKTAFSINGEDTIVPKDPEATIGQRDGFSRSDRVKVNAMYCPYWPTGQV